MKKSKVVHRHASQTYYITIVSEDYWRSRNRMDQLVDSIQRDFKAFAIGLLLFGSCTFLRRIDEAGISKIFTNNGGIELFIFLIMVFIIFTILVFRDYYRAARWWIHRTTAGDEIEDIYHRYIQLSEGC